jgi:hypothetical protein
LIYWNPGGIRRKVSELRILAQLQDAHLILLGGTLLTPNIRLRLPNFPLRLPNFVAYRHDELSPQGQSYRGTAVLVREIVHDALPWTDFTSLSVVEFRVYARGGELKVYVEGRPPASGIHPPDLSASRTPRPQCCSATSTLSIRRGVQGPPP